MAYRKPLLRGTRLGRYELVARLAQGGMAELFLARATGAGGFEKVVVLKKILPQFEGEPDFIRMFLSEARLAATLGHPNVVNVRDVSEEGEDPYFTMDYIHGESALALRRAAHREKQRIPIDIAVAIAIAMCAGLHHAHTRMAWDGTPLGIVHRDVSPSNVLISYEGIVKVVDFGIARAAARTSLTEAGTRKGKVAYMSPQQCRAERVDRRADIFAIGVVLFELSTCTRLFRGDDDIVIINQVLHAPIPTPSSRRGDYPVDLEAIVMRALAKSLDDRYSTAEEMQRELEQFAADTNLDVSQGHLARYMADMFEPKEFPWLVPDNLLPSRAELAAELLDANEPTAVEGQAMSASGSGTDIDAGAVPAGVVFTPISRVAAPAAPNPQPARTTRILVVIGVFVGVLAISVGAVLGAMKRRPAAPVKDDLAPTASKPVSPPISRPVVEAQTPAQTQGPAPTEPPAAPADAPPLDPPTQEPAPKTQAKAKKTKKHKKVDRPAANPVPDPPKTSQKKKKPDIESMFPD